MRQIYQSFTSREEICLLKEKIVKKSSIQTRLDQVYQRIDLEGLCKRINIYCDGWKSWYLPNHGVYHPNKTGKIHAAFDISAEIHGTSINKQGLIEVKTANCISCLGALNLGSQIH